MRLRGLRREFGRAVEHMLTNGARRFGRPEFVAAPIAWIGTGGEARTAEFVNQSENFVCLHENRIVIFDGHVDVRFLGVRYAFDDAFAREMLQALARGFVVVVTG